VKGADVSTQLILSTTAPTAADRKIAGNGGLGKTGIALWGSVLLLLMPGRLRSRRLAAAIMILVVAGSLFALSSCGGTGGLPSTTGTIPPTSPLPPPGPGAPTANYSVTVSATSDTAAPTPAPVTVQLTVD